MHTWCTGPAGTFRGIYHWIILILYNREDKDDSRKSETPTPEVDEDGFCIRPKAEPWENEKGFYSSSDTDSEDDRERKIRVEIKPLSNGGAPMSASVDELRATVENLSLSPAPTVCFFSFFQFFFLRFVLQ